MTDEEYRECIEKLIKGGRQWDAMYELQCYARRHIDLCHDVAKSIRAGDFDSEEIEEKKVEESMQFFGY